MAESFFVVFDTCTHAAYYSDVHQVLSLPERAVIRYEYKRRLYKQEAAAEVDRLIAHPEDLPRPVLLMYGQKRRFAQGDKDPEAMLTAESGVFIPTRSAQLIAVGIARGATPADDVLYLHLSLKGFVRPDAAIIHDLVATLEQADSLPFGDRKTQYAWISLLPAAVSARSAEIITDDQDAWPTVVDAFVDTPTQFEKDIFWRVRGLFDEKNGGSAGQVQLEDRDTNQLVHPDSFHRDYPLLESKRYRVTIETYSPEAHGVDVPAGSSIAMTSADDDQGLLKLSADPLPIVPNQQASKRFTISTDAALDTRFTGIYLQTQVPNHTSTYPPGSECSLTFTITKARLPLIAGIFLGLGGLALGAYALAAKPDGETAALLTVISVVAIAFGGFLLNRQFRILK